ncbi:hypothetical protein [[Mycobacterium] vasticus]|uniref:DUF732 domain-containing protein n=1 Tax=[Mycobacterium] vasticus TaxID=2875777 RepID=A0ABU5Z3M3_9MYCO|nr:hypothetical protein [Mycolicibacter sp. MYC017]MEB3070819.1 hypothetical protein [Mycolicibacter sp. MYC017]
MRQRFARALAAGALCACAVLVGAPAVGADPSDPLPSVPSPVIDDFISAQIPALHSPGNQLSQSNVQGGSVIRGGIGMYCQNPGVECRPPGR